MTVFFKILSSWLILFLIAAPAWAEEDKGYLLANGSEALGKRVRLIREAQHELLISSFILKNDVSTQFIVKELIKAQKRGVVVKLLVDQFGVFDRGSKDLLSIMNARGIEVKIYNPFSIKRLFKISERMHGKLFIADGNKFITGGRNLWDQSFGLGKKPHTDMELFLEGPNVGAAKEYFDDLWGQSKIVESWARKQDSLPYLKDVDLRLKASPGFNLKRFERGLRLDLSFPLNGVEFVADSVGAYHSSGPRLRALVSEAEESVHIETPWIVPTRTFMKFAKEMKSKLIDLKILTNSPRSAENPFRAIVSRVHSWILAGFSPAVLFERGSGKSLHSKYTLIDHSKAYIGSFNEGPRSERVNLEVGVIIESPELVAKAERVFQKRSEDAVPMPTHNWTSAPCLTLFSHIAKGLF